MKKTLIDKLLAEHKRKRPFEVPDGTKWEGMPNKCTLKDLDHRRVKSYISDAIATNRVPEGALLEGVKWMIRKSGLTIKDQLTNAAVLLFGKNKFAQSNVKVIIFKGITRRKALDKETVKANVFDLYDKFMHLLTRLLPEEKSGISRSVFHEVLMNAFMHSDYSKQKESIEIAIFDDRITISNPVCPPVDLDGNHPIKEIEQDARNPIIVHVFRLCRKAEGWGNGVSDIIKESKKAGCNTPKFENIKGRFMVTLFLKNHRSNV